MIIIGSIRMSTTSSTFVFGKNVRMSRLFEFSHFLCVSFSKIGRAEDVPAVDGIFTGGGGGGET